MSDQDDKTETADADTREFHAYNARRAKGVGIGFAAFGLIGLVSVIVGLVTRNDTVTHLFGFAVAALGVGVSFYSIGRSWSRG